MTGLSLETNGDTEVVIRRHFAAPPEAVYRAHIEPDLIRRWMTGPEGWVMTTCISEAAPGGRMHFAWEKDGHGFYATGEYRALEPGRRIAHVERMFLPERTPENECVTEFRPADGGTLMVLTMTLPDAASREAMLATGMADGMEESYARIDVLVSEAPA